MNPDGTSVVTPVERTSMTVQLQQPGTSFSSPPAVLEQLVIRFQCH